MIFIILLIFLAILIFYYNKKAIPIFLYHQVNPLSNVSPELFEEHLKVIKNLKMKTLTMTDYFNKNVEKNSILISFDDGYYDNYKFVFPLLKKYNMKATIFLNTLYIAPKREEETEIKLNYEANYEAIKNYLKGENPHSNQYMTWEEIKEMHSSGLVDFQAHSHKHTAIFTNLEIKGLTKKDEMDFTDIYLYGKAEDNYPIFSKRGEYTGQAVIVKKDFFDLFKKFYENEVKNKFSNKKESLKFMQKFIDNNKKYFSYETEEEYQKRIKEEFLENKNLIEINLKNNVKFFCWPWGHRAEKTIEILKTLNVDGFITTKKGTNALNPNWNMIRRIELRNYGVNKFKINILVARNYILGKIYGWIS